MLARVLCKHNHSLMKWKNAVLTFINVIHFADISSQRRGNRMQISIRSFSLPLPPYLNLLSHRLLANFSKKLPSFTEETTDAVAKTKPSTHPIFHTQNHRPYGSASLYLRQIALSKAKVNEARTYLKFAVKEVQHQLWHHLLRIGKYFIQHWLCFLAQRQHVVEYVCTTESVDLHVLHKRIQTLRITLKMHQ